MTKSLQKNPKESFSKFFNLHSAMNYGRVIQNKSYKVNEKWAYGDEADEENLVMVEPTNLQTIPEIVNHMKKIKIILTYGVDLTEKYK